MGIPAKNGNGVIFTLGSVTLPGGAEAQAIVLVNDAGVPISSWPLPSGASTEATLSALLAAVQDLATGAETQPVSAASLPLPSGAATEASVTSILAKLSADPATQTTLAAVLAKLNASVAVTGPLTDAQLRATALAVSGTFWQATQPVSAASLPLPTGAATNATLTEVRDRLPASPHSQPLTDAQLRATPVPITGSLSMDPDLSSAREVTQQDVRALIDTVGLLVEAIRNQMPMPDSADRMRVNIETGSVGIASNQTLTTVTTVSTVSNQTNVGGYSAAGAAFADFNTPALTNVAKLVVIS
jgi:hypothetical protein